MSADTAKTVVVSITNKPLWLALHTLTVVCFFGEALACGFGNTLMTKIPWYVLANTAVVGTYATVLVKNHTHWDATLASDDCLLLIQALVWGFTPHCLFKLASFTLYSGLNMAHFLALDKFPHAPLTQACLPLLNYLEPQLLSCAAILEMLMIPILAFEAVYTNSYWGLAVYGYTWALRKHFSPQMMTVWLRISSHRPFWGSAKPSAG